MKFIETSVFTRQVTELLSDDVYHELQLMLLKDPSCGDIIKNGGGIRKTRYALKGKGKSGGVRVIYYWKLKADEIYLLLIYPKSKKDTLTDKETALLKAFIKGI